MVDDSSPQTPFRRLHVFLCHDLRDKKETKNEADQPKKGIVLQLSEWLEAHDIDVWRSDKELAGGETWKREIYEKAIPTCDLFIVCLTKNFVNDNPGQRHREIIRALEIAETKHPDTTFILPIRIEQVRYSGLEEKQYINYYKHSNFDILLPALEKKRNQIKNQGHIPEQDTLSRNDLSRSSQKGSIGIWNVPYRRNLHFTGRDDLLDQLEQHLSPVNQGDSGNTRRAALTQTNAIKGLGGIGKTQIAVEYAYRSWDLGRYTYTLWVNAASEEALITSFTTLAGLIPEFPAKSEIDQSKLVKEIKWWLEQCEDHWLLIFDNADDIPIIQTYLPQRGNGSILITTRANAVGSLAPSLKVETMGFIEGTHLLLRRAQRFEHASDEEINQAGNIVVALDHFPLALDQAGAYIEETRCTFVNYLDLYQNHRQALLAQRGTLATDYPHSVATTWSLSFQKVEQANPAAAELLRLCAFLAPDKIPEELITDGANQWSASLQQEAADGFTFNNMIKELLKYSLVNRLSDNKTFSIHRLVQAVQIDMMEPEIQRQWAERVVRAVNEVFPDDPQNVVAWPLCLRYLDQAQVCNTLIEQYILPFIEAADLLIRAGLYLTEHASYDIAELLYQQALRIKKEQLGPEHPQLIFPLNELANLYSKRGKYLEAELLYQRALRIGEEQLGPEDLQVASPLNNLANLYSEQSKYAEAEPLYQRALRIREKHLGPDDIQMTSPLNGLALLYQEQGKYVEAEPLYQRVLQIREKLLDLEDPRIATTLNNLALLYREQGKYVEAEPLYQRVLQIREKQLGLEHPQVASTLNGLALLYQEQGKYIEAEPLYQRALRIREEQLGPKHSLVASPLNNLAFLYREQGKYTEAESLYKRALSIWEEQLGLEHPWVASPLDGLALIYQKQGKYVEAEPLYQRALQIGEEQLGLEHPHTQLARSNYILLLRDMGRDEEARKMEDGS